MKYLIFDSVDKMFKINNRIAVERGCGKANHTTNVWFCELIENDSNNCAMIISEDSENFLSDDEKSELKTQEEFDALGWEMDDE
tara:strand:- start:688 stop:939 length:252 start_codon:yes stop_codon:yes gene_type:complete